MPACYFVDIAEAHLYFDKNRSRCRAPGSRPAGQSNVIYFVRTATASPLLNFKWDEGLKHFSASERRNGLEWVKDVVYEVAQPVGLEAGIFNE